MFPFNCETPFERWLEHKLNYLERIIMASKQEVLDAIAGLGTDIDTDFRDVGQRITDLQTRLANGGQLEANDLDDILNAVNAVRTSTAAKFTAIGNADSPAPAPTTAASEPAPAPSETETPAPAATEQPTP